jgi:hypothetical protein
MLVLKDLQALLEQRRSATERLLKECTTILGELGYYPVPLRSTTGKRIATGLISRPNGSSESFTCELCPRSFRYPHHLGRHKQTAHAPPIPHAKK